MYSVTKDGLSIQVENESDLRTAIRALSDVRHREAASQSGMEKPARGPGRPRKVTSEPAKVSSGPLTEESWTKAMSEVLNSPGGRTIAALYKAGGESKDTDLKSAMNFKDNRALGGSLAGPTKLLKHHGITRDDFITLKVDGEDRVYSLKENPKKAIAKLIQNNLVSIG